MSVTETPRTSTVYHGTIDKVHAAPNVRGCLFRLVVMAAAFFMVLVVAVILVAMSPTLSRSIAAFFLRPQAGSIPWNGTDPVNMVVVGLDQRTTETPHTDTMMVVSINPKTDSVKMLSIPRDLWVTIPNGYGLDRVNDAYADGGPKLLAETAASIADVPIRYYAIIKFKGFERVVDALGGVTIDVKHTINDPTYPADVGYGYSPLHISAGVHHMNGRMALRYVRTRHDDPLGDLGRNERQQQLLLAIKHQALQPGTLLRLPVLIDALSNAIDTNFPYTSVPYLARVIMTTPKSNIVHRFLNYSNNSVSNYTTSGGAEVLLPNWQAIQHVAHGLFTDPRLSEARVAVLNGSGTPGEAATLSQWMGQCGFSIGNVGDADRSDYEHTLVIRNTSVSGGDYIARMTSDLLQTRVVDKAMPNTSAPVVVIVGRDWTTPTQS